MNVACIIVRTNSTRLEKKVLKPLGGKLAIEFLIDRIKLSKNIDEIYLCTSIDENDKILLDIAKKNNIKSFAGDRDSVISRMLEVGAMESADNLIRITGDNFLTDYVYLDIMLDKHKNNNSEYTRTEYLPIGITAEIMSHSMLKDCYKNINPVFSEYLLLYAFNPIKYDCNVVIPPKEHRFQNIFLTVDTPSDYDRTIAIVNKFKNENFTFNDISKILKNSTSSENPQVKFPGNVNLFYTTYRNEMDERISKSEKTNISIQEYLEYAKNK
jgi:spore coat polysaccharide biosynthesis protein SpsF